MLPLGHLGVGAQLVRPWWNRLPMRALLLGAILPDLIDKPLYYVPHLLTGRSGYELGLISGTRSVGHSLLFLALLFAVAAIPGKAPRRRYWLTLALGVATHLFLDNVPEIFLQFDEHSSLIALLFPLYGWRFPLAFHHTAAEHLRAHLGWYDLAGEAAGVFLLWRMWIGRASAPAKPPGPV